jgi:DHA1 family bicyclomycin/chloramphenicol resistance-like MFS transporter
MPTSANRTKIILILGILSAIGPLSIDMYLPAFKNIASALHCSQEEMGYTLSSFFFGICMGQLISGPLLDHFGRKNVLYIGLSVYVLSSIACAFATSVEMLVVFRLFQALGGSVGMVAPNAVIRETFEEKDRPKVMSLMILILGVSPILAPSWFWPSSF